MKIIITAILILFCWTAYSQINIGSSKDMKLNAGEIKAADLKALKSSTTIFIYRKSDEANLEQFKKSLSESWKFSPLQFVSYEEFAKKTYNEQYSFFEIDYDIEYLMQSYTNKVAGVNQFHVFLNLWMKKGGKDLRFARVELIMAHEEIMNFKTYYEDKTKNIRDFLYNQANLKNWFTTYLSNSLKIIDSYLQKGELRPMIHQEQKESLKNLQNQTLYIPEYLLVKMKINIAKGNDESLKHDIKDLTAKYPYKFKVVSTTEIDEMIKNGNQQVYYAIFVRSNGRKYFAILDGVSGEIVYSRFADMSYNIDEKDFKELAAAIKK